MVVRAFPLKEGKEQELQEFTKEVSTNRAEAAGDFYGRYGAERETWHLQETPWGKWVICVTQFSGRPAEEAGQAYGASTAEFDAWFKEQVEALSGVNPETDPLGPPTECIFDSRSLTAS